MYVPCPATANRSKSLSHSFLFFIKESKLNSFPGSHKGRKDGTGEEGLFHFFAWFFFKTNYPFDHSILKCKVIKTPHEIWI